MAIKRFKIEIDDVVDQQGPTNVPNSLTGYKEYYPKEMRPTELGSYEDSKDEIKLEEGYKSPPPTGKTFPDLISEYLHNPRAMATILMFLPFVIFVIKIDEIGDLVFPLITGAILNSVWFLSPFVIRFCNWCSRKK